MPIEPLYIEGIRHFIVVGLSENTEINNTKYPDAEFLLINPRYDIGNFIDGTLDFTTKGARKIFHAIHLSPYVIIIYLLYAIKKITALLQ